MHIEPRHIPEPVSIDFGELECIMRVSLPSELRSYLAQELDNYVYNTRREYYPDYDLKEELKQVEGHAAKLRALLGRRRRRTAALTNHRDRGALVRHALCAASESYSRTAGEIERLLVTLKDVQEAAKAAPQNGQGPKKTKYLDSLIHSVALVYKQGGGVGVGCNNRTDKPQGPLLDAIVFLLETAGQKPKRSMIAKSIFALKKELDSVGLWDPRCTECANALPTPSLACTHCKNYLCTACAKRTGTRKLYYFDAVCSSCNKEQSSKKRPRKGL